MPINHKSAPAENKRMQRFRAREDLKLTLLVAIRDFKSEEEPNYKFTSNDIIHVLSSMITRKTE